MKVPKEVQRAAFRWISQLVYPAEILDDHWRNRDIVERAYLAGWRSGVKAGTEASGSEAEKALRAGLEKVRGELRRMVRAANAIKNADSRGHEPEIEKSTARRILAARKGKGATSG